MSTRLKEEDKFTIGDLVEVTGPIECSTSHDLVGKVVRVVDHFRISKHGYYKWCIAIKTPNGTNASILTKYKYCNSNLKVVFRV